ncbi:MAG: peptide-methionine (R)-S-oxide reductase MsrB [Ferruginibacter sp.]|nr:peptide-methionine (R)-S-oxide reductase MsrB [Ferruginibacter sp.]
MKKLLVLVFLVSLFTSASFAQAHRFTVVKSEGEWKKQLSPEAFQVARKEGTERAYSGKYWNNHEAGTYQCVCCNQEVFSSTTKFESGTGWPSFYKPSSKSAVLEEVDRTYNMDRTKVTCSRCGAHLGHVFEDGPKPTGLRYCLNSVALNFVKK